MSGRKEGEYAFIARGHRFFYSRKRAQLSLQCGTNSSRARYVRDDERRAAMSEHCKSLSYSGQRVRVAFLRGERPQLLRESAVAPRGTPAGFPRREPDHAQGGNPLRSFG